MTRYKVTIVERNTNPDAGAYTHRGIVPLWYSHSSGTVRARSIADALDLALATHRDQPRLYSVEITTPAGRTYSRMAPR